LWKYHKSNLTINQYAILHTTLSGAVSPAFSPSAVSSASFTSTSRSSSSHGGGGVGVDDAAITTAAAAAAAADDGGEDYVAVAAALDMMQPVSVVLRVSCENLIAINRESGGTGTHSHTHTDNDAHTLTGLPRVGLFAKGDNVCSVAQRGVGGGSDEYTYADQTEITVSSLQLIDTQLQTIDVQLQMIDVQLQMIDVQLQMIDV
jgi:hypothetical protein